MSGPRDVGPALRVALESSARIHAKKDPMAFSLMAPTKYVMAWFRAWHTKISQHEHGSGLKDGLLAQTDGHFS